METLVLDTSKRHPMLGSRLAALTARQSSITVPRLAVSMSSGGRDTGMYFCHLPGKGSNLDSDYDVH
jgi:hypothetical protein